MAFANPQLLDQRAGELNIPLRIRPWPETTEAPPLPPGELYCKAVTQGAESVAGQLDTGNADYVLSSIEQAVGACLSGQLAGLVTGPIHKGVINDAGRRFSGHTEMLARLAGVPRVVMMLATDTLRVALATTHLPLREVADRLGQDMLRETLDILESDLRRRFRLTAPRILVCGLNPHAGEGGHLGHEDDAIIAPVVAACRARGMRVEGPLPADTAFTPPRLARADAVLAMYHDQGLPVLKYAGFGRAVNITLGLPFIRTSVDHGTALDIAGSGSASPDSLLQAIEVAARMATMQTDQEPGQAETASARDGG